MCAVRSEGSLCQDTGNAHIEVMRQQSGVHKETKKEWAKKWEECERENTGGKSFAAQAGLAFTKHLSKLRFSASLDIGSQWQGMSHDRGRKKYAVKSRFPPPPTHAFPLLIHGPFGGLSGRKTLKFWWFLFLF